ncbi:cupin domain-containing protein [Massilia sp. W12]|uniref:cupin domain-containing protein n=1 Tax=Massilia sp. W12 TaxID=3126507 RepID=UPI0030D5B7A6
MSTTQQVSSLLGEITPARFMAEYWQKRPLLVRQAIPGFQAPIGPEALAAMAAREDVESRLVSAFDGQWQLQHGPLTSLPARDKREWSMLVQGVNLHDDACDALMRRFNFLPLARLDDLMISFATDGGGVGPHFDSYDVFLLQAHGQRRWRISAQKNLDLIPDLPLKILQHFTPEQEFVLEPGDMLYLPPHYAHDGVALGDCMTYSIGFRAPSFQELGEQFLQFMLDSIDLPGRYADPDLKPVKHVAEISPAMLKQVTREINKMRFTSEDITVFLGQYLTEAKPGVWFDTPQETSAFDAFLARASASGVRLSRKSQMLYTDDTLFINGESYEIPENDSALLQNLANHRRLSAAQVRAAGQDVQEALHSWHDEGWLFCPAGEDDAQP